MANGLVLVTGVVTQGFTGVLTTTADGLATVTNINVVAANDPPRGVPVYTTPALTGVHTTGTVSSVIPRGFNFKQYLYPYVTNQIPEYIRDSYPQFVNFIQAYYRFLDSTQNANDILLNSGSWTDIDNTLDVFVDKLRGQFAADFPNTTIVDGRRFVKQVHEFYESKGTEQSIEMFFRVLYDDEIQVNYPSKTVLRASDGRWQRDVSIKLDTRGYSGNKLFVYFGEDYAINESSSTDGYVYQIGNNSDPFDLIGKNVDLKYWTTVPGQGLIRVVVPIRVSDVKRTLNPVIYDIICDIDPLTTLLDETTVEFGGLVYGMVTRQFLTFEIVDPGVRFFAGDIIYVNEQGFAGLYFEEQYLIEQDSSRSSVYVTDNALNNGILRVLTVLPNGGVETAVIVNTGYLYTLPSFQLSVTSSHSTSASIMNFTTGYIYQHQGIFTDASGLLSDACKLQDNLYYQPYSYVIKTKIDPSIWMQAYLKTVHPAGIKLFSNFITTDNANFRLFVSATDDTRETLRSFVNTFIATETISYDFYKVMEEDFATVDDLMSFDLDKVTDDDTVVTSDSNFIDFYQVTNDSIASSDVFDRQVDYFRTFTDAPVTSESTAFDVGKALADFSVTSDSVALATSKALSDTSITDDSGIVFEVDRVSSDTTVTDDSSIVFNTSKALADTGTTSDATAFAVSTTVSPDTAVTSDSLANTFSKALTDTVTSSDSLVINDVTPFANETALTSDSINSFDVQKGIIDTPVTSESTVFDIAKPFTDATNGSTDSVSLATLPVYSDSVVSADVMTFTMNFGGVLSDATITSETFDVNVTWSKIYNENVITGDSLNLLITWDRQFADTTVTSESVSINTQPALSDAVTSSDTGTGYVEDYTDPTYSDPGYTGYTFSF